MMEAFTFWVDGGDSTEHLLSILDWIDSVSA